MTSDEDAAARRLKAWRESPKRFVDEVFGVALDGWQEQALDAYGDPSKTRISMQACAGPGKSALLAWSGWHFMVCQGDEYEHPKGAAVSVTADNLKDNLWPEFAKWQGIARQREPILSRTFTWTKERLFSNEHPETWFMSARSYSKTANAEEQGRTLSGLHSKYVLALVDESGDIPLAVAKAAEQALSTKPLFGKILQAGNPTSHDGMLYAAAKAPHLWHVVRITGDPEDPDRSPRIDIEWAKEQIAQHGREDPWVMAYILGLFPPNSINALLGPDEVAAAMARHLSEDKYDFAQKRLGVDCARFGMDANVIFPRQGLAAFQYVEIRGQRSNEIAARVAKAKADWGSELEFVDGTGGYGSGVIDALIQAGHGPIEVQFAGKATDSRYLNKRAEMWFDMAAWVKRGGAIPKDGNLAKELVAPTYTFSGGRMKLEEKDQIKARLGFSPDRADALALTFAMPDMPAAQTHPGAPRPGKLICEYEPYATSPSSVGEI